jgi:alpha-amylase/alpha-mannosidase (GH57 family)
VTEPTMSPNGWIEWKHPRPYNDYLEVATNKERVVIGCEDLVFDVPPYLIDWLIDTLVLAKEQVRS